VAVAAVPRRAGDHAKPMKNPDVIVIGAGAAGLMCAITAAGRGRRVLVLERANKAGKKILMSGGGRCNFTNLHISPDCYISANPHFCKSALSRYTQWDFIAMVEKHGIAYFEKETVNGLSGQLFCQQSSRQIVAMLMEECLHAGVEIRLNCDIRSVAHGSFYWGSAAADTGHGGAATGPDGKFHLRTSLGNYSADRLVVAAGGLSVPSLGGSGLGYELAECFGLELLPRSAGLVPFTFTDTMHDVCGRLAGVSSEVVLFNERKKFREDILFTHRGLSGPAALQLSSYWQAGEAIGLCFLPDDNAADMLRGWKQGQPSNLLRTQLQNLLPRKLVLELQSLWWHELADTALAEWSDARLEAIAQKLEAWRLKPAGTEGYRTAEVTLGGVDTSQLSSKTMESGIAGLYFIGEVVDVTGQLGGFNFQWAWSSGYVAGLSV
jgi:predicted Rossmann fold flavoprotein